MKYTAKEYLNRIENKKINSSPLYSRDEIIDFAEKYAKQLRIADVVGQSEQLPQDKFCKVCNLPTDGEKCYSKRCPV